MNKILEMIKIFLESDLKDATDFSIELEDALCEKYDEMEIENKKVTESLNEEIPDICAGYEFGEDIEEFKKRMDVEYKKAIAIIELQKS